MLRMLGLLAVLAGASGAYAAGPEFPSKPINIVVTLAPGGVADIIARALGQRLTETWGQPVIVENKAGGNTQVGAAAVAKSPPDGHTLLLTPEYTFTVNPLLYKSNSDPTVGLTPVSGLVTVPMALAVRQSFPARDIKELVAWAKANPGRLNYGVPGIGSVSHLSMELLQSLAGVKFNAVAYRGAAPALTDIIAGHIDATFAGVSLVTEPAKAGQMRLLGISDSSRIAQLPDVHAISQQLPGFETTLWFGLFAPEGTPAEIVSKLNGAVQSILAEREFEAKYLTPNAYMRMQGGPGSLAAVIAKDRARWTVVIRDAGIKAPD